MSTEFEPQIIAFPPFLQLESVTTYEASQQGFLGCVAHELHVAPWNTGVKDMMRHVTYQPKYDRLDKCGIFEFFAIDERTVQSRKMQYLERY
jgi:hypothetical protein